MKKGKKQHQNNRERDSEALNRFALGLDLNLLILFYILQSSRLG